MTNQLISYHNSSELKQEILNEVREQVKNDQLIQGEGWNEENQKGCFIGCLTHCYDHQKASIKLGIPIWLLRLADKIHEGLPPEKTGEFFIGFVDALQKGMTKQHTGRILHQFLYDTLTSVIPQQYQTKKKVAKIIGMFKDVLAGSEITIQAWRAAADYTAAAAAADAAAATTRYAAAAAAADAAAAAAAAAVAAADYTAAAAWSAADYTAATDAAATDAAVAAARSAAARQSSYEKIANSLIQTLKEVRVR